MTTESLAPTARRVPDAAATAAAAPRPDAVPEAESRPAPLWLRPAYSLTHAGLGLSVAVRVSARPGT
ncbi:MAG: hypothetical protein RL653_515 [Pseudomonadota bacterium]|jgi:hypothetical protein